MAMSDDSPLDLDELVRRELAQHYDVRPLFNLPPERPRRWFGRLAPQFVRTVGDQPVTPLTYTHEPIEVSRRELERAPLHHLEIHYRVQMALVERRILADFEEREAWAETVRIGAAGLHWMRALVFRVSLAVLELAADRGVYIGPPERHRGRGWGDVDQTVAEILARTP